MRSISVRVGVAAVSLAVLVLLAARSPAATPPGRYTYPATGVVYDVKTKLTWQQTDGGFVAHSVAASTCAALTLAGGGWRLPTMKELLTLIDYAHPITASVSALDPVAFPQAPSAFFWSSSAQRGVANSWMAVDSGGGTSEPWPTDKEFDFRCVR
jgi:hypothetical protein